MTIQKTCAKCKIFCKKPAFPRSASSHPQKRGESCSKCHSRRLVILSSSSSCLLYKPLDNHRNIGLSSRAVLDKCLLPKLSTANQSSVANHQQDEATEMMQDQTEPCLVRGLCAYSNSAAREIQVRSRPHDEKVKQMLTR